MKLKKVKVVAHMNLKETILWRLLDVTRKYRPENWFAWEQVLFLHNPRPDIDTEFPGGVVCVVSYELADKNPKQGLNRRNALKILREAGMRPPECMEVFRLSTQCLTDNPLPRISMANNSRRIMCTTAINPEFPDFYYFGLGSRGQGSFRKEPYRIEADGSMVFWGDRGCGVTDPAIYGFNFPLLLGVVT